MVMFWKVLFLMILFYLILIYFILFYLFHDATYDVIIAIVLLVNMVIEVLRCNEPLVFWQMEQPILLFIMFL